MRKIAVFGGTFNPIHTGHLIIAHEVCRNLGLNKIVFVPAYIPPHKKKYNLANATDRYKMVKMAIKNNPKFDISPLEIKRKGKSYSVDTIRDFRKAFGKKTDLFFIIGSDTVRELKDWRRIGDIHKLVKFLVVQRPGYPIKKLPKNMQKVGIVNIDISSSEIRRLIKRRKSIQYLVPDVVMGHILKNKIYSKN